MRIAYVSESVVPSRYANSIHVMKMCQALADLGHEVTLLAADGGASLRDGQLFDYYGVRPNFTLRRLPYPASKAGALSYALRCGLAAARLRADLIYGRTPRALFFATAFGSRCVFETHQPPASFDPVSRLFFRLMERGRRFHYLVVISQALRELVAAQTMAGPILVAHDAVDAPQGSAKAELPGTGFKVGYFGHFYPGRGINLVLSLARRLPEAEFHLVGGQEEDLRRWLEQGPPPNLRLHGFVPPAQVAPLQRACHALLMPYQRTVTIRGEGDTGRWMSPLKMFEYMASGVPLISSDLPVLREVLRHEENALLAPPADPAAWEAALRRLMAEPELGGRLAAKALAQVVASHTWLERARRVLAPLEAPGAAAP